MTAAEKRQRLIDLGYDPNDFYYEEDAAVSSSPTIKPLADSLNTTSIPGAFTRSFARGALPSLAAGAGAFGVGSLLDLTGIGAPIGIPLQIAGAGIAGFGARRLQDILAPKIIPGYTESEQQDVSTHPLASTLGTISSTIAGGLNPSIANIPRAGRTILDLTRGISPARAEIQNLANVGLGAIVPPAQETAISLAQGEGIPSLQDLLLSSAGGAIFSKPNIIGRKLFGWENVPPETRFSAKEARESQRGVGVRPSIMVKPEDIDETTARLREVAERQKSQQAQLDELTELASETGKFPGVKPGPKQTIPGFETIDPFLAEQRRLKAEQSLQTKFTKADLAAQRRAERIAKEVKLPEKVIAPESGEFPPIERQLDTPENRQAIINEVNADKTIEDKNSEIAARIADLKPVPSNIPLIKPVQQIGEFEPQIITPASKIPIAKPITAIPQLPKETEAKPLTANQLRIMQESLTKRLAEGQTPETPLQQTSPEISEAAERKGYTLTPTQRWHEIFQKLGVTRGVSLDKQGLLFDSNGNQISGEAYLRRGINDALVKINSSKAGLDTWPHELFHIFYHDLLSSDRLSDNKLAQTGDTAVRASKEYDIAKANDPSLTPHEFLTKRVGADVVRRVLQTEGKGKFANWLSDFWSYIKARWNPKSASVSDYARLFSNRLLYDRPFRETTVDTTKQTAAGKVLHGKPLEQLKTEIPGSGFEELTATENQLYDLVKARDNLWDLTQSHINVQTEAYEDFKAGKISREKFDSIRIPNENSINKYVNQIDKLNRQINQIRPDVNKSLQQPKPEVPKKGGVNVPADMMQFDRATTHLNDYLDWLIRVKEIPASHATEIINNLKEVLGRTDYSRRPYYGGEGEEGLPQPEPEIKKTRTPAEMLEGPGAPPKEGEPVSGITAVRVPAVINPEPYNPEVGGGHIARSLQSMMSFDRARSFSRYIDFLRTAKGMTREEAKAEVERMRQAGILHQNSPELSPLHQEESEMNIEVALQHNISPETIPQQHVEREYFIPKLRAEITKIRTSLGEAGKTVANAFTNFYEDYNNLRGKYVDYPIKYIFKPQLDIGIKSGFESYLKQDSPAAQHVRDYLWDIEDKGRSDIKLTANEQIAANSIKEHLTSIRDAQNARPGLRKGGYNPNYIPFIPDREVLDFVVNKPNTAEAKQLVQDFIKYQISKGATKEEALNRLQDFRAGYAKEQPNLAKQFGPIDKAAGIGIPRGWRETNLIDTLARYGNRVARRFSYHDNMEATPEFESALTNPETGVAGNESVKTVMRDIAGIRPTAELVRTAALGLLKAGIFGPLTGVRNFAQNFTIGLEHSGSPALAVRAFNFSWNNIKQNIAESFKAGVNRQNIGSLEFGDQTAIGSLAGLLKIDTLRRARDILSDIQLRNPLEQVTRAITFGQGKFLAMHYLAEKNQLGRLSKDGVQFFKNFAGDIDVAGKKEFTPDDLNKIASRLVENIQGTYDYRGLPAIAVEGTLSPFLALSRWSIERSNNFMRYVVTPALHGNIKPFLLSTLGMMIGGEAVNAITQFATKKKERTASVGELAEAEKGSANIVPDVFYKMAALSSVSGYAGILGDFAKLIGDEFYGKIKPQSYNNALVEAVSNTGETFADLVEALREGDANLNTVVELVSKIASDNLQTYRVLLAHFGPETKENTERINKLRDLRVFNTLYGNKITDLRSTERGNVLTDVEEKKFKKTQDLGEAISLLPGLIQNAFEKSKGNPDRLKAELQKLKTNQYPMLPSPDTIPLTFIRYLNFLKSTQGEEEATRRLTDYLMRNEINKEKAELVPSI